jgi:hypothetical protein
MLFMLIYRILTGIFWGRAIGNAIQGRPIGLATKIGMPMLRRKAYAEDRAARQRRNPYLEERAARESRRRY